MTRVLCAGLLAALWSGAAQVQAQSEPFQEQAAPPASAEGQPTPPASAEGQPTPPASAEGQPTRPASTELEPQEPVAIDLELPATEMLAEAENTMLSIEYERSLAFAEAALRKGPLQLEDTVRAYRVLGVAAAQLGQVERAERAFLRLLALEPQTRIAKRLAPERRGPVLSAKGFWSVREAGFRLDVRFDRRERTLHAQLNDPIQWGRHVHVWHRFGQNPFVRAERRVGAPLEFEVSDEIEPSQALEVYAYVTDEYGNVLNEFGDRRTPRAFVLSDEELAALSLRDIRGGQTGSFGKRLEELGAHVGVHGYVSLEVKEVDETPSFDVHHATLLFRAELISSVSAEFGVEFEHLARRIEDMYMPHAFIDVKQSELLTVRAGFFEAPIGAFNEYLYPDFLRITGLPPLFTASIVPALWSEVGVQLRGRLDVGASSALTYAAFISNGLEQRDGEPNDGVVAEGGDLRAMRFNDRDRHHGDKAFGGRLGLEQGEFDLGASAYTGRYTIEAARRLNIFDMDASYRSQYLTIRAEAALALQDTTDETLRKYGGYLLVAGRPLPEVEPYAQYDFVEIGTATHRGLVGFALYPFPNRPTTRTLRLKSEAGYLFPDGSDRKFFWFEQLTASF